jgi:hypothetical protein
MEQNGHAGIFRSLIALSNELLTAAITSVLLLLEAIL